MDFVTIKHRYNKNLTIEVYPEYQVVRSKDLMVRGGKFYAIWDEEAGLWSTDEYDVQRLIDNEMRNYISAHPELENVNVKWVSALSSNSWLNFKKLINSLSDNAHQLDEKITFANTEVKKKDYISRRLPYSMEEGSIECYDELISTLYDEDERKKIEWAIGSIISGDSKSIQKFIVLYGDAGTGKSTILNIIQKLFEGYYATFEAKALTNSSNAFATEAFRSNPLVAIQHDGDLSRIEDNTKLNSIVSHEQIIINEKYKSSYPMKINCFLFMGTNKPVKITDAKSGIIRRLLDVRPTGNKVAIRKYNTLLNGIDFELGAIAYHCLQVYLELGKSYYNLYRPVDMMFKTDVFFNFVEDQYFLFSEQEGISLKQAYTIYKEYCDNSGAEYKLPMYKFREELKNYFTIFEDIHREDGKQVRSYYSGFIQSKFQRKQVLQKDSKDKTKLITFESVESVFDKLYSSAPAQYASEKETPIKKWSEVTSTLADLDTTKLHYVKLPENHIVIDFDLKDDKGNKSLEKNIEAASKWPKTYAELSKSGCGIHLHYIYEGDVSALSRIYDENIEIKVFTGNSSLRRKLSKCNALNIEKINSGLPLKKEKKNMLDFKTVSNEKALRTLITKNLNKEIHGATKPSVDFIFKILNDAYDAGMKFDVRDMRSSIMAFCVNSTNNADYCLKLYKKMHFCSEDIEEYNSGATNNRIIFFDIEVFPNLFLVNWKYQGKENPVVRMINPTPKEIEKILSYKLIGFNNRRYDNHILYARYLGYSIEELYEISQKIVSGNKNAFFGQAYNLSYTDVYDFCAKKQSLKKWEIELGIHHQELGLPWDKPVDESLWQKVAEYCDNDVIATEAVFDANQPDFIAREILADISGLSLNDTTNSHTTKIIFGDNKKPQSEFVYTDLSEKFPGYVYDNGKSTYRGEETGEGGYVYSEPGMYTNVALLDIASMHPTSIEILNLFGPYTEKFSMIKQARIAIKHKDYISAGKMFDGKLAKYLKDDKSSSALAYALKIAINSVYGLTSAKFENPCRDPRNIDNIVAKHGALFMINLKHEVQDRGFTVAHIKTDSIKIPNATPEIISFVMDYAKQYGYTFEHEATYEKMCLVNDAVYIAKYVDGNWTATGTQFAVPYVFKTLFSKEPLEFKDFCETKTVTSSLYLDMNEKCPEEHQYEFIGKAGSFCPIKPGCGGGLLMREKDGKYSFATGTKGYRWLEAETVKNMNKEEDIDKSYYISLADEAIQTISKYGDFEWFVN